MCFYIGAMNLFNYVKENPAKILKTACVVSSACLAAAAVYYLYRRQRRRPLALDITDMQAEQHKHKSLLKSMVSLSLLVCRFSTLFILPPWMLRWCRIASITDASANSRTPKYRILHLNEFPTWSLY